MPDVIHRGNTSESVGEQSELVQHHKQESPVTFTTAATFSLMDVAVSQNHPLVL